MTQFQLPNYVKSRVFCCMLLKFFSIAKGRIFVPPPPKFLALLSLLFFGKLLFFLQLSPLFSLFSLSLSSFSLSFSKKTNFLPLSKLGTEKKKKKKVKIKNTFIRASHRIVLVAFSTRSDSIGFVCSREIVFNVYACGLTLESEDRTSLFVLSFFLFERRKKKERAKGKKRKDPREKKWVFFRLFSSFPSSSPGEKTQKRKKREKNKRRCVDTFWLE